MPKKKYDSTVARIAGNIAAGFVADPNSGSVSADWLAERTVAIARAIVAEVERTDPVEESR